MSRWCFSATTDWAGFNVPLNTLKVISGTGFYGSDDPTNSVKALKEVVVLRIGFNPTRSTSQHTNMQHTMAYRRLITHARQTEGSKQHAFSRKMWKLWTATTIKSVA